ncbi:DUF4350 domain-containing protein [Streptomyces uncialis]|uniref:DUF4350 domain-containing protein n=1 Tax=Streptomyces uncialis TaxID=1048205 RepID=UPI002E36070E|nr:DUF4350 domain-containing protein [Streptomyces uncialis]
MTHAPLLPSTSASPTARQVWTRARGPLIALVIVLVGAVAIAAVRSGAERGRLDPRSAEPLGSRAVSELLADRGVDTRVVTTTEEAAAAAGPGTTLLVAAPDLLTDGQWTRLRTATAESGGRTVLVAPGPASDRLVPGVTADQAPSAERTLGPDCALPAANRAGDADTGGYRYHVSAPRAESCYPSGGLPTLVRVPAGPDATATAANGDTVVIGSPGPLYNDRLDEHGNASLALQLLGSRPQLVWYLPSLSDDALDGADREFTDLIPSGWLWATLQLGIAFVLTALWRARRLGPLVPERLPVAIRASETAEGRARLYRKANARDRAADALRTATRTRLAPLVGVSPTQAHAPEALLPALAARLRTPEHGGGLPTLLFGPPPGDDAALTALADQLDTLEREVRTS